MIDFTDRLTRPMSEEKRAAIPAGASLRRCERSVPTSRANIAFCRSVSVRITARCTVVWRR